MQAKDIIQERELLLLQHTTRKSQDLLAELLSDDFLEFGASGKIYLKQDILSHLPLNSETSYKVFDMQTKYISESMAQLRYKMKELNLDTGENRKTLRSSLWRNEQGIWKMFFHQGTITTLDY